jgi:hypothetical protein
MLSNIHLFRCAVASNHITLQSYLEKSHRTLEKDQYHLEKIVGRRKDPRTGANEYLVKWLGYADMTWTKEHYFDNPRTIINANAAFDEGLSEYIIHDVNSGSL